MLILISEAYWSKNFLIGIYFDCETILILSIFPFWKTYYIDKTSPYIIPVRVFPLTFWTSIPI